MKVSKETDWSCQVSTLGSPDTADGAAMRRIAGDTGVRDLDSSSPCLLWRRDFSGTSVVARDGHGRTPGSITGYLPPEHPQTSVVRQVAFDEDLFPKGLGHEPEVLYRNDPSTRPNSPKDVPQ